MKKLIQKEKEFAAFKTREIALVLGSGIEAILAEDFPEDIRKEMLRDENLQKLAQAYIQINDEHMEANYLNPSLGFMQALERAYVYGYLAGKTGEINIVKRE